MAENGLVHSNRGFYIIFRRAGTPTIHCPSSYMLEDSNEGILASLPRKNNSFEILLGIRKCRLRI
jgi:hypothetical protein